MKLLLTLFQVVACNRSITRQIISVVWTSDASLLQITTEISKKQHHCRFREKATENAHMKKMFNKH